MDARVALALLLFVHLLISLAVPTSNPEAIIPALQLQLILLVPLLLMALVWQFAVVASRKPKHPAKALATTLWSQRSRIVEGIVFILSLAAMMQIYMVIKVAIPQYLPFYADPYLADMDLAVFGSDPWRLTHMIIGPTGTRFLDYFYIFPCVLVTMGMTVWACFSRDRVFSRQAVLAIALCWLVLGNWGALAMSSAGPAYVEHFYGDNRYAELFNALPSDLMAVQTQNFLLENFGDPGFGKGISAMPSMHNALHLLLIWMLYDRFGASWQLGLALIFELVVFVASVHLGWHYAMDGIVSAVLVPPVWYFAKNIERWQIVKSAHSRTIPELKLA